MVEINRLFKLLRVYLMGNSWWLQMSVALMLFEDSRRDVPCFGLRP